MAFPQFDPRPGRGDPQSDSHGPGLAWVPPAMLEACRSASLLLGGPALSRLGITSALREEGRTSVALAFARVQREDLGRSVLLLDLDLENPGLARQHGLDGWPGVAEVLRGERSLEQVLQPVSDGILMISPGAVADGGARTASDLAASGFVAEASRYADVVIGDLPPQLGPGPGLAAARAFDRLLLVVRAGVTPTARIREAVADLPVTPSVLLNGSHSSMPGWARRLLGR